jgi:hypothetical protein
VSDFESEKLEKRTSRQASIEASFKKGQGSTSGCRAIEERKRPYTLQLKKKEKLYKS